MSQFAAIITVLAVWFGLNVLLVGLLFWASVRGEKKRKHDAIVKRLEEA